MSRLLFAHAGGGLLSHVFPGETRLLKKPTGMLQIDTHHRDPQLGSPQPGSKDLTDLPLVKALTFAQHVLFRYGLAFIRPFDRRHEIHRMKLVGSWAFLPKHPRRPVLLPPMFEFLTQMSPEVTEVVRDWIEP